MAPKRADGVPIRARHGCLVGGGMLRFWSYALALLAAVICGSLGSAANGEAQTFPTRIVRSIVPFAPGASTDLVARLFGQKLSEAWGQQVVVENRGGAGGGLGADMV